ncbi:hypothetical protein PHYC_02198 [Phycisphaerales bacterium]|nr:hypothetical protein PHYC_02198 [Phycisphaerales bacterium]
MPFGPGIDDGDSLIEELEGDGLIRVKRPAFKKDSWLFELLNPEVVKATPEERDSIRRALAWLAGRGAVEISNHTHRESRSWKRAHAKGEKGKELDIYLDLVPDEKYTCMGEQIQRQDAILSKVFGQHQR